MGGSVDKIVVLGAGAKAVALAAKAAVLRDLGHPVPEILVVEPAQVASSWTGAGGMTSGELTLGTPPEKDVGFPYLSAQSWRDGAAIDAEMHRRFSWASYLIGRGTYQEWIDRGKPHPRHREWGQYLTWVSGESGMQIRPGAISSVEHGPRWHLRVAAADDDTSVVMADGLVITGYGNGPAGNAGPDASARYLDVAGFWHRAAADLLPVRGKVIVVGAGESAAGIVEHLLRQGRHDVAVVCPRYTIYTRGESLHENELYSNPGRWQEFPVEARREFINRTDRGVFSVKVASALSELGHLEVIGGRAVDVKESGSWAEVTVDRVCEKVKYRADLIIEASGRDAAWFLRLLATSAMASLADALDGQVDARCLQEAIGHDLSVRGLAPRLHLPNLADLTQGPGFHAMTCLGLTADRILSSYLPSGTPETRRLVWRSLAFAPTG